MGYLDTELKIKSAAGIRKYLIKHFKDQGITLSIDCIKASNSVRCYWAIDNHLHQHDIKDSFVIYVIKEKAITYLIQCIEASLKQRNNG